MYQASAFKKAYTVKLWIPEAITGSAGKTVHVRVKNYQNTGSSDAAHATKIDYSKKDYVAYDVWPHYNQGKKSPTGWIKFPAGFSDKSINRVHTGKGSPEEISAVLQLVAYGAHLYRGDPNEKGLFDPSPEIGLQLQWYCDNYIGLDCLGFVVNFFNHRRKRGLDAGNTDMDYFTGSFRGARVLRESLGELKEEDIVVYLWNGDLGQNSRHIAVIDSFCAGLKLVESRGGVGLSDRIVGLTPYFKEGMYGKVFKIDETQSLVYIVAKEVRAP